jgi:3-oxoacyl-(acyl-carrier-protein) synthase
MIKFSGWKTDPESRKDQCSSIFIFSMKDDEEILLYRYMDNETPRYVNDDYFILNFLTEKTKWNLRILLKSPIL